jgi:probable phosphoglycerate mutase
METAQPLADLLSQQVEVNEAFREIPAPVPLPDRQNWLRGFMGQTWSEQPPELWGWRDRALQQVLGQPCSTVIFTHFLVINAIAGAVQEREETLCFWPDNASITHLRKRGNALEMVALGRQMETVVN